MVEGARLESVYMGNCIEGSNPSVSADGDKQAFRLFVPFLFWFERLAASAIRTKNELIFSVRNASFFLE